jgi:hypothetical protein
MTDGGPEFYPLLKDFFELLLNNLVTDKSTDRMEEDSFDSRLLRFPSQVTFHPLAFFISFYKMIDVDI